ncbi:major facilitator superfamily domain-containing protein [Mycena maculata]|uniref:Major facilitator superfamily domain-containing protein n=1 Tax=Mycena maculata TaxID=230809 RepID=A0AAD7KAA5_9AGAR|nr:major facilitator superfamily domain-containing protein [Mycena maculata]
MEAEKPGTQQRERAPARFAEDVDDSKQEGGPIHPTVTNTTNGDTEKGSSAYAASTAGLDHRSEYTKAERRLLFKLDIIILPLAALLYLSAYLDRGNLGNARLQGLESTVLNGSDTNYSIALSTFFITYIVFSIPGTLLAKAILPSTSISIGALIWSIAATCQAGAFSPGALYVCRLFVGIGEALFGQAMALYFSYWYLPDELSKRIGLFISAGSVAGAFGGLISFGVSSIKHSKIVQWRILFLIEGIPSFVLAICVFLFLPSRPQTSRYISEEQRTLALTRLNRKNLGEGHTGIDYRAVKRAFMDWKTYSVAIIYSCMNLGLGSVGGFLPTIIKGLGYTNAKAQLFTVPPYVVTLVFMLLISTYSDRFQTRGVPVACVFLVSVVGWGILLGISPIDPTHTALHTRYFGCICIVAAGYANIPLIMAWQSGNTGAQSQRAVSLGMLNAIGQCLSILAAFLFPTSEGPKYIKGCAVNVAFSVLGLLGAVAMTIYYRLENRRRDRVEGGTPPKDAVINVVEEYDLAKGFRYTP